MQIDAHQHFWQLDRGDYHWLTPSLAGIYRDFGPDDLAPYLNRYGIDATILVQAAPTIEETHFLLALAKQTPFVAGVVGWVDFLAPEAEAMIDQLASDPYLLGLRPMIQDIADDDWLLQAALDRAVNAMIRHNLVFDALIRPRHLSRLLSFAQRFPDLSIVIDHGAKPAIAIGQLDPWRADIAALADIPNVTCKLSGLATEASDGWTGDMLKPYIDHLLTIFGPKRLIWGSDWPVVNLAGGYDRWCLESRALIGHLEDKDQAEILGGTALRVYVHARTGRQINSPEGVKKC